MAPEGKLARQALELVADKKFEPHSVHIYYTKVSPTTEVSWSLENISQGRNFANKAIEGRDSTGIKVFVSCSLTARNSFQKCLDKYQKYEQLIEERRKQGKSPEDDEEDDIVPAEVPFRFQVPFPEDLQGIDVSQLGQIEADGVQIKVPVHQSLKVDLGPNSYNPCIKFFARLKDTPLTHHSGFMELLDAVNVAKLNVSSYKSTVLERVVYFHDTDFDVNQYMIFQGKIIGYEYGKLLWEYEVFNSKGVHVISVQQETLVLLEPVTVKL